MKVTREEIYKHNDQVRDSIMLKPPFRLMCVARSQMGKTTLMIKLMQYYWLKMFNKIYIFCPTYAMDRSWRCIDKYVLDGKVEVRSKVENSVIQDIWDECNSSFKEGEHKMIYFDDCAGQHDFKLDKETGKINMLVSLGNHSNISTVWVVQKVTQCSTIMRANAEGIITFYVQSEKERKYIYDEFGIGSYKTFKDLLENCTGEKYSSLYVNRQGPGKPDYYKNFRLIVIKKNSSNTNVSKETCGQQVSESKGNTMHDRFHDKPDDGSECSGSSSDI
jgi:hypothetical protein